MKFKAIAFAASCLLVAPSVMASSLMNMDTVDYEIIVSVGETTNIITIKAGQTIDDICDNCIIQIAGDDTSVFDVYVNESVAIRQGKFFLPDEEE